MIRLAITYGEMVVSPLIAAYLLWATSIRSDLIPGLLLGGAIAWTLAEYGVHRFVLHDYSPASHRPHHHRPNDPLLAILWQVWVGFVALYLVAGGVVLAGALLMYAWHLYVHHCAHHAPDMIPAALLRHHALHHRFASRNFGDSTTLWDHIFGTKV
jgi:sterol desaturase/sphingolipid hydroxylase (fatty acid hydroxylase superfamily)